MNNVGSKVKTLTVPYIPNIDGSGPSVEEWISSHNSIEGFLLHEIQASRVVMIDGEWTEIGYQAIYIRE